MPSYRTGGLFDQFFKVWNAVFRHWKFPPQPEFPNIAGQIFDNVLQLFSMPYGRGNFAGDTFWQRNAFMNSDEEQPGTGLRHEVCRVYFEGSHAIVGVSQAFDQDRKSVV